MTEAEDTYVTGLAREIAAKLAPQLVAALDPNQLLTATEAMDFLKISRSLLDRYVKAGEIRAVDIGSRSQHRALRFRRGDLTQWADARAVSRG